MRMEPEPDWVHWQPADIGTELMGLGAGQGPAAYLVAHHFVQYRRPDRPCSVITISVYPAQDEQAPGAYRVAAQVEWAIGEDPGDPDSTEEVWSDSGNEDIPGLGYGSLEEAAAAAEEIAAVLATGDTEAIRVIDMVLAEDALDWDGLLPDTREEP